MERYREDSKKIKVICRTITVLEVQNVRWSETPSLKPSLEALTYMYIFSLSYFPRSQIYPYFQLVLRSHIHSAKVRMSLGD